MASGTLVFSVFIGTNSETYTKVRIGMKKVERKRKRRKKKRTKLEKREKERNDAYK